MPCGEEVDLLTLSLGKRLKMYKVSFFFAYTVDSYNSLC
jgi:hypothetical protein